MCCTDRGQSVGSVPFFVGLGKRWIIQRVNIKMVVCQLTAQLTKALRGGSDEIPDQKSH